MTLLDEKDQTPSLAFIATVVSILTVLAFGGVWALSHAGTTPAAAPATTPVTTVEGNI